MSWDDRYMGLAKHIAGWSKDPNTKVGCVIVSPDNTIVSLGYNGPPRDVQDLPQRFERPRKYLYTEHAERNAIYNAVRSGGKLEGASLYTTHYPCADCARAIIQSGIRKVISAEPEAFKKEDRWYSSKIASMVMLIEAKIIFDTV